MVNLRPNRLFEISITDLNNVYETLIDEMRSYIDKMRAMGISEQEIYNSLLSDLKEGKSIFRNFKGGIETIADELVVKTSQTSLFEELEEEDKYIWQLDPTVQEHCADCLKNSEQPAKLPEEWQLIGTPGSGSTECGDYCKCVLVPESNYK